MITVCIASIPDRAEMLTETVKSLLPQVDFIKLCLNNYDITVAVKIKQLDPQKISYIISNNEKGDAGKFFWADSLKGYVFTCDDDMIFANNYVHNMKAGIEKYSRRAIVSCHGRIMDLPIKKSYYNEFLKYYQFNKELRNDVRCHVIGTGCMAWHSDTIRFSITDFHSRNMADIHFAIIAQKFQVPLMVIAHGERWIRYLVPEKTIYSEMSKNESEIIQRVNAIEWKI